MVVTEVKALVFLTASLTLLLLICGLTVVGLLTRPRRWSDRFEAVAA